MKSCGASRNVFDGAEAAGCTWKILPRNYYPALQAIFFGCYNHFIYR